MIGKATKDRCRASNKRLEISEDNNSSSLRYTINYPFKTIYKHGSHRIAVVTGIRKEIEFCRVYIPSILCHRSNNYSVNDKGRGSIFRDAIYFDLTYRYMVYNISVI